MKKALLILFTIFIYSYADASLLFSDGAESGLGNWVLDTQGGGTNAATSTDQARTGSYSFKFQIGSNPVVSRSELRFNNGAFGGNFYEPYQTDIYWSYWIYIPSASFNIPSDWGAIGQWHHSATPGCDPDEDSIVTGQNLIFYTGGTSASPTLTPYRSCDADACSQDGWAGLEYADSDTTSNAIPRDQWIPVVIHNYWSYNSPGVSEAWINGQKVIDDSTHCNVHNDIPYGPYFKIGIYATTNASAVIYVDDIKTGTTLADVTSESDTTAPTINSTTISTNGLVATIVFSETVSFPDLDSGELNIDCTVTGNDIALTSPSGSGTTWDLTIGSAIQYNDVCNLDFTGDANSVEDTSGNDLATLSDSSVTNNSQVGNEPPVYSGVVEGLSVAEVEGLATYTIEGIASSGTPATIVEQTGTVLEIDTNSQTGSQALTIPGDADIMILAVSGTVTGAIPLNSFTLSTSSLTRVVYLSGIVYDEDVALFQIVNPASATLYWDFGSSLGKGMVISIAYYKGVNTSDPIRDSIAQTTGGADVTGMSAFTGDMMVGAVFQYGLSPTVTDSSQTELANRLYNNAYGAMASKVDVGDFYWTGDAYGYAVALVLKHQ